MERRLRRRKFLDVTSQLQLLKQEELRRVIADGVKLEKVLGLTVNSNAALSCDPSNGNVAYAAGCTVVLYNSRKNRQAHLVNVSRKSITCVAFSPDGQHIATGETGHQPAVRVWDVQERAMVSEFQDHKFGISCVAFSPNNKYLVSVGNQHDQMVIVWNWKGKTKVASNKVSVKVRAVSFAPSGDYFVTVGIRHVKFWYLERNKVSSKFQDTVPLSGRSAILSDQRNNYFCDVICGIGDQSTDTYCITQSGLLCQFNSRRLLTKWVELKARSSNCMCMGSDYIFVGCSDGLIRVFLASTLHFVATLPKPHYLGIDVGTIHTLDQMISHPPNARYPDVIAVQFDDRSKLLTCTYSDRSLYQWDVSNLQKIGKAASFLFHSSSVWNLEVYPHDSHESNTTLPPGTFITCGNDDTVRLWNIDSAIDTLGAAFNNNNHVSRNLYSQELLKVLYYDPSLQHICDLNDFGSADNDAKNGIKCIRTSPDGRHLASGDRSGNIRVHDLITMSVIFQIEAHDSEVLCIEYSNPEWGPCLMASASRDRLIHLFDVGKNYAFIQTIDDHSSSINSLKFAHFNGSLHLLSCGADKSLIFREISFQPEFQVSRSNNIVTKTNLYDMDVDPFRKSVCTACQDRHIRMYGLSTGKQKKSVKGSPADDGNLLKVQLDCSGLYAATTCSDKTLSVVDVKNGDCIATTCGHSEMITSLKFTPDCKHLISCSVDGCIFIWRIHPEVSTRMLARLSDIESSAGVGAGPSDGENTDDMTDELDENGTEETVPRSLSPPRNDMAMNTSVDLLPAWAQKQVRQGDGEVPVIDGETPKADCSDDDNAPGGAAVNTSSPHVLTVAVSVSPNSTPKSRRFEQDRLATPFGSINFRRPSYGNSLAPPQDAEDDPDAFAQVQTPVYYPQTPASDFDSQKDFEVRNRAELLQSSQNLRRSDSFCAEGSDDEANMQMKQQGSGGISAPNIHAALAGSFVETTQQQTPIKSSPFERGGSGRQSITSRFLQQGSGGSAQNSENEASPHRNARGPPPVPTRTYSQPRQLAWETTPASGTYKTAVQIGGPSYQDQVGMATAASASSRSESPQTSSLSALSTDRSEETGRPLWNVSSQDLRYANMPSSPQKQLQNPMARAKWEPHRMSPGVLKSDSNSSLYSGGRKFTPPPPPSNLWKSSSGTPLRQHHQQGPHRPLSSMSLPLDVGFSNSCCALSALISPTVEMPPSLSVPLGPPRNGFYSPFAQSDFSEVDYVIRRARSMNHLAKNKMRRRTLAACSMLETVPDEEYTDSDLHIRSKSPSSNYGRRRNSSMAHVEQHTPQRIGPSGGRVPKSYFGNGPLNKNNSASLSSLASSQYNAENSAMYRRMSELRDRLRKSSENLALSHGLNRSKSQSSLNQSGGTLTGGSPLKPDYDPSIPMNPDNNQSSLESSSALARSLTSLQGVAKGRPLTETIESIKRLSRTDLSNIGGPEYPAGPGASPSYPGTPERDPEGVGSFYDRASTLPRSRHIKNSSLQRLVDKKRGSDRYSASGDSDSDAHGTTPQKVASGHHRHHQHRYQVGTRGIRVNQDGSPLTTGGGHQGSYVSGLRKTFEGSGRGPLSRHTMDVIATSTPKRRSYLATLLTEDDQNSENRGYFEGGARHRSEAATGGSFPLPGEIDDARSCDSESTTENVHFEKMSKHCQESLAELKTSLDKVLQAHQLVSIDPELSPEEREYLLNNLNFEMKATYRRLAQTLELPARADPEGRISDTNCTSPSNTTAVPTSGNATLGGGGKTVAPSMPPSLNDEAYLEQFSDKLLHLIQKKMTTNSSASPSGGNR